MVGPSKSLSQNQRWRKPWSETAALEPKWLQSACSSSLLVLIVIFVSFCCFFPTNRHSVNGTHSVRRATPNLWNQSASATGQPTCDSPPAPWESSGRSRKTCANHLVSTHKLHRCVPEIIVSSQEPKRVVKQFSARRGKKCTLLRALVLHVLAQKKIGIFKKIWTIQKDNETKLQHRVTEVYRTQKHPNLKKNVQKLPKGRKKKGKNMHFNARTASQKVTVELIGSARNICTPYGSCAYLGEVRQDDVQSLDNSDFSKVIVVRISHLHPWRYATWHPSPITPRVRQRQRLDQIRNEAKDVKISDGWTDYKIPVPTYKTSWRI